MMAWSPRYLVRKAPGIAGPPIPDDEPCIVIRAQDRLAGLVIRHYLDVYALLPDHQAAVVDELIDHQDQIREWQQTHTTKTADR